MVEKGIRRKAGASACAWRGTRQACEAKEKSREARGSGWAVGLGNTAAQGKGCCKWRGGGTRRTGSPEGRECLSLKQPRSPTTDGTLARDRGSLRSPRSTGPDHSTAAPDPALPPLLPYPCTFMTVFLRYSTSTMLLAAAVQDVQEAFTDDAKTTWSVHDDDDV